MNILTKKITIKEVFEVRLLIISKIKSNSLIIHNTKTKNVQSHDLKDLPDSVNIYPKLDQKIDEIFKLELINSINILEMIAMVIIGYQEKIDLQFRLKALNHSYDSVDLLVKDLERLWLVRNKYSRLNQTVKLLRKVKKFIKISIEYQYIDVLMLQMVTTKI